MSKLSKLGHFFQAVGRVAPTLLLLNPITASIAMTVQAAIQEAEQIHGSASGAIKLAHVIAIAKDAAEVVNTTAGKVVIDPAQVEYATTHAVAAVISASKIHPS